MDQPGDQEGLAGTDHAAERLHDFIDQRYPGGLPPSEEGQGETGAELPGDSESTVLEAEHTSPAEKGISGGVSEQGTDSTRWSGTTDSTPA